MKLTLLPTCLQCYLPELCLEVDFICLCHFITDMIVYTYAKFGMNCLKNKWNITHCSECCVGSLLQYIFVKMWYKELWLQLRLFCFSFFYPRLMLMVSCQRYDSSWVQALQLISVLRLVYCKHTYLTWRPLLYLYVVFH